MFHDPICGMQVEESGSLRIKLADKTYYFCSEHCLKKFAGQNNIDNNRISLACPSQGVRWYKNKALIVSLALVVSVIASYLLPVLVPFRTYLLMYLKKIWWAVLLGLFLGGLIDHFIPREYISSILARPSKRAIFYSAILGFFVSACCHGILAISIELHKKGASNPAVVAFLLASPWANLTLAIMFIGFFGLIKALYIILSALVVAITTGLIYQFLESKDLIEKNKNIVSIEKDYSIIEDLKKRVGSYKLTPSQAADDIKGVFSGLILLADMVLWWVLIGIGLASLVAAYMPQHIFHNYMGPTPIGLLVTLALATVMEVCSEGTAPLAFEIYRQTQALGNAFVFLMAGVVTDYTEIGLLWVNVGKRVAIWLPIIAIPQVIILGILANIIFR